jgi:hypothetical protein
VRQSKSEKSCKKKIFLEVDQDDAFDYSNSVSHKYDSKGYDLLIKEEVDL